MSKVETMRWRDGRLELIDQRLLPERFEYVVCDCAERVAEAIRSMIVRGAPAIGCAAAYGIALEALRTSGEDHPVFDATLEHAFEVLARSRPTAVNLFWALERMRHAWKRMAGQPPGLIAATLLEEAHDIFAEDLRSNLAIGERGAALVPPGARILTHCNAGALATAGHGTALGVIRSAQAQGKNVSVIAAETRPFLQGARLTAWEMVQEDIPVTLVTDNMVGYLMSRGEIDLVVVGADRVAANGDVANKIGTYTIAVLAERHGIPFYVACPLSTIDRSLESGSAIPIEERSPEEVLGFRATRWAAEGVRARNPAFDVTPAALVTALITEKDTVTRPEREKIERLFERR
ncbi:S-methyl-5-thioribose-1-phosphate isomerase [Pelomicrobium methylotrophicum]|uniref:Methylthioribose-1-phosphate isomerase n=1 Tax=Pelomicrobium methylotrophicum TaxID=2602750 RepID=A0A5C7F1B2_9PROT|nr:S-methyl-5-thioribose-1-phosphate isomerase [Pelomicrobium methylotrophicum]TXF13568.1 S-methyl-5-thioribose-1-phosphate isomerase [Pelomicrobium methylotrophicum]